MDCEQIESDNIAELYLMGKLESFKKAQFEIHFLGCRECADLLFETLGFREALRAAAPEYDLGRSKDELTRPATSWRKAALVAAAALVVALLPSALLLRDNLRLRQQFSQVEVVTAPLSQPEPQPEQNTGASQPQNQKPEQEPSPDPRANPFPSPTQINTPIIVLTATRGTPASNQGTNEIAVGASQWFVISLELENRKFEQYRATILTPDRRTFWKSGDLRPDRHDAITIGCAPGFFRAGDYLLILEGQPERGSFSTVGTYPFRVVRKKK